MPQQHFSLNTFLQREFKVLSDRLLSLHPVESEKTGAPVTFEDVIEKFTIYKQPLPQKKLEIDLNMQTLYGYFTIALEIDLTKVKVINNRIYLLIFTEEWVYNLKDGVFKSTEHKFRISPELFPFLEPISHFAKNLETHINLLMR